VVEVGRFVALQVDGEDVETGPDVAGGKLAQVVAGEAAEDAALAGVDGDVGGGDVAGSAGFDLDEAEGVPLRLRRPGDQVEVAGRARGVPGAGDDDVATTEEPEEGGALAVEAGFEVFGAVRLAPGGTALDGVNGGFEKIDAKPEEHCRNCRLGKEAKQRTGVMRR